MIEVRVCREEHSGWQILVYQGENCWHFHCLSEDGEPLTDEKSYPDLDTALAAAKTFATKLTACDFLSSLMDHLFEAQQINSDAHAKAMEAITTLAKDS